MSNSTKHSFLCWPPIVSFATLRAFCRSRPIRTPNCNCAPYSLSINLVSTCSQTPQIFHSICVCLLLLFVHQCCLHTIYILHVACKMPASLSSSFSAVCPLKSPSYTGTLVPPFLKNIQKIKLNLYQNTIKLFRDRPRWPKGFRIA